MLRFQVEVCSEDFMVLKRRMQLSFTSCNASDYFSSHPDIKLMLQNANRLCNTVYTTCIFYIESYNLVDNVVFTFSVYYGIKCFIVWCKNAVK